MRGLLIALLMVPHFADARTITTNAGHGGSPPAVVDFACSGFAASGTCGVNFIFPNDQTFFVTGTEGGVTPSRSGTTVIVVPGASSHAALNLNYQPNVVNVQHFTATWTFVPNGWNNSLILNNNTNNTFGFNGANFSSGAGCEGSFFQGYTQSQAAPPNKTFALEFDQDSSLVGAGSTFTYSSVQIYDPGHQPPGNVAPGQSPCNPDLGSSPPNNYTYVGVDKISTSPVPLNSPSGTQDTTTGDTYTATVTYSGTTLTVTLFDVTAGGSCPGVTCFSHTWTGIDIPTIVGGNTAWVGIGGGTNNPVAGGLIVKAFSYSH